MVTRRNIVFVGQDGITVMEADGSNERVVHPEGSSPAWSADGTMIAFGAGSDDPGDPSGTHIWVIDGDGNGLSSLTRFLRICHDCDPCVGAFEEDPTWSPNGLNVIFASERDCDEYDLYRINSTLVADMPGQDLRLTNTTRMPGGQPWDEQRPAWFP
jgi:Tol biopolymer transport system component